MIIARNFLFLNWISLLLLSAFLLTSCNAKNAGMVSGHYALYEDDSLVDGPVSQVIFDKVAECVEESVSDLIAINRSDIYSYDSRSDMLFIINRNENMEFDGGDATVVISVVNHDNYFRINISDKTYGYKTDYYHELRRVIYEKLTKEFPSIDFKFYETGTFLLNN